MGFPRRILTLALFAPVIVLAQPVACAPAKTGPVSTTLKCDGVTDDAPALGAALDAADPAHGGSGNIVLPASSKPCLLGTSVSIHSGETLTAAPGSAGLAPFIPYTDPQDPRHPVLLSAKDVSNVTIRNLTVDGAVDRIGISNPLMQVSGSDHVVFDTVTVKNSRGFAVSFVGGKNGVTYSGVKNSTFDNIGNYYLTSGNKENDRKQSVVFCCSEQFPDGIYQNQHNFALNSTWGYNGFGDMVISHQSWFLAQGNHFNGTHNAAGIYCASSDHIRILDNVVRGASGNGIDCFKNQNLEILNNDAEGNGAAGIQAAGTQCGIISGNKVLDNGQQSRSNWTAEHPGANPPKSQGGITVGGSDKSGETTDLTIENNLSGNAQASPIQQFGVRIVSRATVSNVRVMNNQLTGNTGGGYGEQAQGPSDVAGAANCKASLADWRN